MTDLPPNWVMSSLENVCEILDSKRIPINQKERKARIDGKPTEGLFPYYGATGQVDVIDDYLFEGEHILVGEDGAPFLDPFRHKAYVVDGKFWVNNHAHILRAYGSNKFVSHYLNSIRFDEHVSGTTRLKLTKRALTSIPIALPPNREQHRIVERIDAMFDEIDRGVESLRDAKGAIRLYRQSLLKSAFEGRLTANWRAENPDKLEGLDALLARIREERETRYSIALEDWERSVAEWRKGSENGRRPAKPKRPVRPEKCEVDSLRELPDGWFYLAFDALAQSIRNGISVKPDEIGPLKIFRISAVRPMAFDLNDFRQITDPDGSMEAFRLEYGDLVFTRYNGSRDYVGVSAMYRGDGTHVYPDKLIRCHIDSEIINTAYLEAATNCGESRSHVEGRIRTTAGQSGVSGNDIKTIPVPICSPAEQAEIVRILDARLEAAEALDKELDASFARADALRQSILKKAFAGELVTPDAGDEPAQALLARIRSSRSEDSTAGPRRRTRRRASTPLPP